MDERRKTMRLSDTAQQLRQQQEELDKEREKALQQADHAIAEIKARRHFIGIKDPQFRKAIELIMSKIEAGAQWESVLDAVRTVKVQNGIHH